MAIGPIKIDNPSDVARALADHKTTRLFPETPLSRCPRCGLLVPDYDGFGVLEHLEEGARSIAENAGIEYDEYPRPCGYCSHPGVDGDRCNFCGAIRGSEEYNNRRDPSSSNG
jgi:hypothetical protein